MCEHDCACEKKAERSCHAGVLTLQRLAETWRLINSVLAQMRLVPTAQMAMIKRDKGQETLPGFLGRHPHVQKNHHILTTALLTLPFAVFFVTGSFLSLHSLFSEFLSSSSSSVFPLLCFSLSTNTSSRPSLLISLTLSVCQASHQSPWLVPNYSAGSILSSFVWRDQNNQHKYGGGKPCFYGNIQLSNIHISQTNLA